MPEINYLSTNIYYEGRSTSRREICFKGPMQFCRYFEDSEKTAETIDAGGWAQNSFLKWLLGLLIEKTYS